MKKTLLVLLLLVFASGYSSAQISTYPYINSGGNNIGWFPIQGPILWYLGPAFSNPAGVALDTALICNFSNNAAGTQGYIVSPAFNFTALTKPVIYFYTAYRSRNDQNDSLQFLISTDGGITFIDVPTPYRKSFNSTPSLATGPSQNAQYNPSAPNQWRHETIDLTAYAGQNNLLFAFRGVSAFGNDLYIDDFIVTNNDNYCQSTVISPGTVSCSYASVIFNTVGLVSPLFTNNDNPAGGVISFSEHLNQFPVPSANATPIAVNTTATTQDGSIFTPNLVAPDAWFTVSYTGNDRLGYANYNISINVGTFISLLNINKLYIVKRSDLTGRWVSQNTTVSGTSLIASGLTTFSDFAVAGDSTNNPLPVELTSFVSIVGNNNVDLLWTTSSEINNSGFDIERSSSYGQWAKIGFVNGNGTSSSANNYSFNDRGLAAGKYNYRLKQIDFNGNYEYYDLGNEVIIGIPEKFELSQNYPNPFNPVTVIAYNITSGNNVNLKVFDSNGKEIMTLVNERKEAGSYSVQFDGSNFASGIYYYSIQSGNFTDTKKMIMVK